VPVGDYDAFAPAIQRMRQGERNLLVPERVKYFGCSSGSSNQGRPKYLPITDRAVRFNQANGSDAFFRYLAWQNDRHFTRGFILGLFPPIGMTREGPVLITSNPALIMAKLPPIGRAFYLPDRETMHLEDYDAKLEVIAERYLDHDVRAVSGTTCWFGILFDKLLAAARRRGRPATTISELWPNLRVLIGGGVAAGPYLDLLKHRVGREDLYLVDTYNATEGGVYAATDHLRGGRGMLMIPHRGVFFEFVPLEDVDRSDPPRVPLWQVEPDRLYAIVVTTGAGLYSYTLGDIVRFPSIRPLRIEFAGRLSGCLSTTQELVTHVEIETAFEAAARAVPATAVDYAAGADVGVDGTSKSRYLLFVEFLPGRAPADLQAFLAAFDTALGEANRVYREHREGEVAIRAPELVVLRAGAVDEFLQKDGTASVQSKFPRIVDDPRRDALRGLAAE